MNVRDIQAMFDAMDKAHEEAQAREAQRRLAQPNKICSVCKGAGWNPSADDDDCSACDGLGVIVVGDVLPVDDEQFVIALTPGLVENTDWATREALAAAVADAGAAGLADSWWAFAEKPLNMDANGDVWA